MHFGLRVLQPYPDDIIHIKNVTHTTAVMELCSSASVPWLPFAHDVSVLIVMQGTAGEPLAPGQLATALQGHEMFLYFGHGSGDQYLSARYTISWTLL